MKLISFEKKLGLFGAVCVTVGAVVGVAIFVIVGEIGAKSGPYMPLVFALAAVPAIFGSMVAVALGSTIPADGGGFYYATQLLGKKYGVISSWLVILGAFGSIATVSIGVADYIRIYFPLWPYWVRPIIAMSIILLAWAINTVGLMASEKFQIAMVAQMCSALLIVIVIAVVRGGNPDFSQGLPQGMSPFVQACVLAAVSYIGFNIIAELGDEVENPRRTIPLTIMFGLGIIIVIYVGVGWVVAVTMGAGELGVSEAALLDTARRYLPKSRLFMHYLNIAAMAGAVTSINSVFLAIPREFSAQAEEGLLPKWIMRYNPKKQTFPVGIAIVAVVGCILVAPNLKVGVYGLFCVAGLNLANVFFSIGVMRLFRLFPEKVASSPIPIRKYWVYPAGVFTLITSLFFGLMALFFFIIEIKAAFGL